MASSTFYAIGTVTVANGGTAVTGVGTAWADKVFAGDLFANPTQPMVPPQRIASVTDDTHLVLAVGWPGTAMAAAAYEVRITPDSARVQENTRQLLEAMASASNLGFDPPAGMTAEDVQAAIEDLFNGGLAAGSLVNAKLADMASATIKGRASAGSGAPEDLTMSSLLTLLRAENGIREKLTAARTYYVDGTNGDDANDGLATGAGHAFKTIQKAVDVAASLDCSTYNLTVQVANGTYTTGVLLRPLIGSGTFTLRGDPATPSNVFINSAGNSIGLGGGNWVVTGFKVASSTGFGIINAATGILSFGAIEFGACSQGHIYSVGSNSQVIRTGNYSISGGSPLHIACVNGGYVYVGGGTVTLLANVTISSAFIYCDRNAVIAADTMTFALGAFAVTGKRFNVAYGATLITGTNNLTYFPGTIAGSIYVGGQYDDFFSANNITSASGNVSIGAGSPALGKFTVHAGADMNLYVDGPFNLSDGVSFGSLNDAGSNGKGFEFRGTDFLFVGNAVKIAATFGYATGLGIGGAVTQAPSKSTGVSLTKPNGQITMNAAALGANAEVTFTFTNAHIEANDILILNHSLTAKYAVNAVCAAGSAAISVRNLTAGSLSEALVIKYAVLKGSVT